MSTSSVSQTKAYRCGTHRVMAPRETVARLEPLVPGFGITRVANLTGLDRVGVPVVMVCRPNARSSAVFHGKGVDFAAAKASGLMEAIETWHAEHVHLPLRLGTQAELRGAGQLVDAERLPRRPASRFHGHLAMLWVEGRDLVGDTPVWVPFETVHANATGPDLPGSGCFAASTNGLASGNSHAEAVSHALCEVIERDATSIWHRMPAASQRDRRVALDSVDDADCRAVLDRLRRAALDVGVWDTTTDIGVPAFQCIAMDRAGPSGHVGEGAGCHPAREVALLRALTEAVQVRMTYLVGSREDIRHSDYLRRTLDSRRRRAEALIRSVGPMRDFMATPRHDFLSLGDEIAWILRRLRQAGIRQAVAVDLTRPEFEIPVVRVVVPGLEGSDHHTDYVPGSRVRAAAARAA